MAVMKIPFITLVVPLTQMLDRIVRDAQWLEIRSESMRKTRSILPGEMTENEN